MSADLTSLYPSLNKCLYIDQIRLRNKINKIKNIKEAARKEASVTAIKTQITEAQLRLTNRENQQVHITYPEQLPVSQQAEKICEAIKSNQVVIVAGETGSGKTTQLPKICLDAGLGRKGLIGHTQPRRLAARTVSTRIAEELQVELGGVVGYQVRFTDQVSDQTLVKVMTDGILLSEVKHDKYLNKYDAIIIDEAHERSLNIDFLLGYLKRLLSKRKELKLIITSATIDVARFSEFFEKAPIFSVSGRTFPVDVKYRPALSSDEYTASLNEQVSNVVEEIIEEEKERGWPIGDVLIFLPGEREIRELAIHLKHSEWRDTEILPLYARLSNKDQNRVFSSHRGRRIILSTNVAETSITVPGIRYVIDPGTVRMSRYSYRSKIQRLPIEAVSQASANQRMGRCGRIAEGICYRLYSDDDFISRSEFTDPEILRTNLASVILKLIDSGLGSINDFEFIDEPDNRLLNDGYKLLHELEAVTEQRKLTPLGKRLAALPTDPKLGKMLLTAAAKNCLREVLIIVSGLSIQDPRERPNEKQQAADQAHSIYKDPDSDFIGFIKLWENYEEQRQLLTNNQQKKFCQKNFLSFMRMREWREIHRQLHLILKTLNLKENTEPASTEAIHQSLLSGLLGYIGRHNEKREYDGCRNRKFTLFPGSSVSKKKPKWLFSAEIVETQQVYARCNAKIDPAWIEPLALHLIKKSWSEPLWHASRAQVIAKEKVSLYGLEIVTNRPVNFSQIDPVVSREIFIRSGLVELQFKTKATVINQNRRLITDLEALEDRTRKRDILVDDETVYDLYDKRLSQDVTDGTSFEKWYKRLPSEGQNLLLFTKNDLQRASAPEFDASKFPGHLDNNGIQFPLSYQFNPGAEEDGVTISVPVNAIKQLTAERLERLVPGLLREKCIQLIKNLPRPIRRNFVPVPDMVDSILSKVEASDLPLLQALNLQLKRKTLVDVPIDAWNFDLIDSHLKFNIQVLNDSGKIVQQGRDIVVLADKVDHLINIDSQQPAAKKSIVKLTDWNFGELEESVLVQQAGIKLTQFPALNDKVAYVELILSADEVQAKKMTRKGIARLYSYRLTTQAAIFKKQIPSYAKLALLYSPVGKAKKLYDDFLISSIMMHFLSDTDLPKSKEEFEDLFEAKRADYFAAACIYSDLVFCILEKYHQVMKSLKGKINLSIVMPLNDLRQQLAVLIAEDFLLETSLEQLKQFPRYLEACQFRFDKMARDLANERRYVPILNGWWEQYLERKKLFEAQGIWDHNLASFRWLVEEQRVSWYAQHLGTSEIVSEKRLNKHWELIRR